jgi:hypothetical protein
MPQLSLTEFIQLLSPDTANHLLVGVINDLVADNKIKDDYISQLVKKGDELRNKLHDQISKLGAISEHIKEHHGIDILRIAESETSNFGYAVITSVVQGGSDETLGNDKR